MLVNQIATMLNDIYGEYIGETGLLAEDLSNIVSVGQVLTQSTAFGDNFENAFKKVVDKVGLTLYGTKGYNPHGLGIIRYGMPAASVVEKLRVDVVDYTNNQAWEISDPSELDFSDIWDYVPATITATYFNKAVTFKVKISLPEYQFKSAFNSPAEMVKFIGIIEMRIQTKMRMAADMLEKRVLANLIAEKGAQTGSPNVYNLLSAYNAMSGNTLTAAKALADKEFLRFASKTIGVYRALMREETGAFNNTGYVTHTDDTDLKMFFLSDFAKSLESSLYSDTFHDEYVKQDGYREIGFWQGFGTTGDIADRSKLIVKPASTPTSTVTMENVLAVLMDKDAAFIAGEMPTTKALPNPDGDFTNYWHKFKASYYNDLAENCIVFTMSDPVVVGG